jgi:proline/betaine transport protein TphA
MASSNNTFLASIFGNALEWYDFILYANFAPIIANLFFPAKNPVTSLLLTFIVFATGFLVRPVGALIFGHIGDHWGRRKALIVSISIISIPTFLIGLVPSYHAIGILAPVLLTLLRLFQGIAVSGELNTSSNFLIEHNSQEQRGFRGSLVMGSAFLGILVGAATATFASLLFSPSNLQSWAWRIPFLFGGVLGLIGIFIRLNSVESPKFLQQKKSTRRSSLKEVLLHHPKELLLTIVITSIMGVGNYMVIAYVITLLVKFQGFPLREANIINFISLFVMTLLFPVIGMLSDKFGRKPVFLTGILGFIFLSIPVFWLLSQKHFALALF